MEGGGGWPLEGAVRSREAPTGKCFDATPRWGVCRHDIFSQARNRREESHARVHACARFVDISIIVIFIKRRRRSNDRTIETTSVERCDFSACWSSVCARNSAYFAFSLAPCPSRLRTERDDPLSIIDDPLSMSSGGTEDSKRVEIRDRAASQSRQSLSFISEMRNSNFVRPPAEFLLNNVAFAGSTESPNHCPSHSRSDAFSGNEKD